MLHLIAEELFSLGPHELGCLEDKDKPGAKVGCSTKCDDLSISMNVRDRDTFSIIHCRSASSPWSCRDCLPPYYWWTNRAPPPLISLTVLAGTALRLVSFAGQKENSSFKLRLIFSFVE